ncbi:MAG: hypothetical protein JO057_01520 [Chloroflexi bacterium]|nr:hypothetical protein [Chloroflexota bacterium]
MRTHTKRQRRNRPGVQHLWGFDNGHLASAVNDAQESHLWELTVFDGNGRLASSMPNRPEVMRALRPVDVRRVLRDIQTLP